jgi:nicotinate phosphoribosyltransferase
VLTIVATVPSVYLLPLFLSLLLSISGVPNFLSVAWALYELGYKPVGVRLDSGDLAELSKQTRALYKHVADVSGIPGFATLKVVASNDINEAVLLSMSQKGHEVDVFGIGTNLVTCQAQPALGCVYKLVEINGRPRIKLSNEVEKLVIPCRKTVHRLYGADGKPICDIIQRADEPAPREGERVLCRNPFKENDRVYVTPSSVRPILNLIWDGDAGGALVPIKPLKEAREFCIKQIASFDESHIRPTKPKPYRVSVSASLYDFLHELWMSQSPIAELS